MSGGRGSEVVPAGRRPVVCLGGDEEDNSVLGARRLAETAVLPAGSGSFLCFIDEEVSALGAGRWMGTDVVPVGRRAFLPLSNEKDVSVLGRRRKVDVLRVDLRELLSGSTNDSKYFAPSSGSDVGTMTESTDPERVATRKAAAGRSYCCKLLTDGNTRRGGVLTARRWELECIPRGVSTRVTSWEAGTFGRPSSLLSVPSDACWCESRRGVKGACTAVWLWFFVTTFSSPEGCVICLLMGVDLALSRSSRRFLLSSFRCAFPSLLILLASLRSLFASL